MYLTVDFETNNHKDDCHVWLWASCDIYNIDNVTIGEDIESFFMHINSLSDKYNTIYFHNLKFDGEFVCIYLLKNGYEWTDERKLYKGQFATLISDMGVWYSIKYVTENGKTITILDSAKIYPFKIKELAPAFGMEISKGEIDYNLPRPKGYKATELEKDYITRDVKIPAIALKYSFDIGDNRMTAGSNALANYKRIISKKAFEYWFPELDECEDEFIRASYKGAWTYVNPKYKNIEIGEGLIFDVNSLYPFVMRTCLMPYGKPKFYEGKYKDEKFYPLYVQRLKCSFELKKNKFPTLQLKKTIGFAPTQYVSSSNGEIIELTMTNVDLQLFFDHYNVSNIEWICGYMFHGVNGMFDEYIDYWMTQKQEGDKEGNKPKRTLSKLKMNSLYGKFAKRPKGRSKKPYLDGETLKLQLMEEENHGALYIPVGSFITAYARNHTIRSAQNNYKRFMYADTDSLHLCGTQIPDTIHVDAYELGAWKCEGEFVRSKYLGPKCYIEEVKHSEKDIDAYLQEWPERSSHVSKERGTILQITCAGLPDSAKAGITFDNFKYDLEVRGKLVPRHVPGGLVLEETTYKIKKR